MARTEVSDLPMHCVICTQPVPEERLRRKSVTCSKLCNIVRNDFLKSRTDQRRCRYCMRPSTPHQRAQFMRWVKFQKKAAESVSLPLLVEALPALQQQFSASGRTINTSEITQLFEYLMEDRDGGDPAEVKKLTLAEYVARLKDKRGIEGAEDGENGHANSDE